MQINLLKIKFDIKWRYDTKVHVIGDLNLAYATIGNNSVNLLYQLILDSY